MALFASIVTPGGTWRVASFHLESGTQDRDLRTAQTLELVRAFADWPGPALAGGDANLHGYGVDLLLGLDLEPAARALRDARFEDAHVTVPLARRGTTNPPMLVIDLLFGRGVRFSDPGIGSLERCWSLSDHLPVWAYAERRGG
jgi:endonuclease/exonuclease/phosphatase family metal-dependent hydrolase